MGRARKVKCQSCGKVIDSSDRYCGYCREKNNAFDASSVKSTSRETQRAQSRFYRVMILAVIILGTGAFFLLKNAHMLPVG